MATTTTTRWTTNLLCRLLLWLGFLLVHSNAQVTLSLTGLAIAREGDTYTLTVASINNPGNTVINTFTFAWGDGSLADVITPTQLSNQGNQVTHVYDDGPQTGVTILVFVNGLALAGALVIGVFNVPPTADFNNDGPVAPGSDATVSFTNLAEPSLADTGAGLRFSYDLNGNGLYDDGAGDGTYAGSLLTSSFLVPFGMLPGLFNLVNGRIIDKDEGFTDRSTTINVIAAAPSLMPSELPSELPSESPSKSPSKSPTKQPSVGPSTTPTLLPSSVPSSNPSNWPTTQPTALPSSSPSLSPSADPTTQPSNAPSHQPSSSPSHQPSPQPSSTPTESPSSDPTTLPSNDPSHLPSSTPTDRPSSDPSSKPTSDPTELPSNAPSHQPSSAPTNTRSSPSRHPSSAPSLAPSASPSSDPTTLPSNDPSHLPSSTPTDSPSSDPSSKPSSDPTAMPSNEPSHQPSSYPTLTEMHVLMPSRCPQIKPRRTKSPRATTRSPSASAPITKAKKLKAPKEPKSVKTTPPSAPPTGVPSAFPTGSVKPSVKPVRQMQRGGMGMSRMMMMDMAMSGTISATSIANAAESSTSAPQSSGQTSMPVAVSETGDHRSLLLNMNSPVAYGSLTVPVRSREKMAARKLTGVGSPSYVDRREQSQSRATAAAIGFFLDARVATATGSPSSSPLPDDPIVEAGAPVVEASSTAHRHKTSSPTSYPTKHKQPKAPKEKESKTKHPEPSSAPSLFVCGDFDDE